MKQIVFLSGKGGTGKTTLASSLACLAAGSVSADCDVDGSNMPIAMGARIVRSELFYGIPKAVIDATLCDRCGLCEKLCRFDAVKPPHVRMSSCEGCMVCFDHCPRHAISQVDAACGSWFISDTCCGPLVHARLNPGEENSGLLVNRVRGEARRICKEDGIVVIDGPPGIGCPAIASLTGCDLAVVVAEPSEPSLHDAARLIELIDRMGVKLVAVINKYDLSAKNTRLAEDFFANKGVFVCGKVGYDDKLPSLQGCGRPPVLTASCRVRDEIERVCLEALDKAFYP